MVDVTQLERTQMGRVLSALKGGTWLTLPELHDRTGDPIASISAQLRTLRKVEGGSHNVVGRRRSGAVGLGEYRLIEDGPERRAT